MNPGYKTIKMEVDYNYTKIETAIKYLSANFKQQPSLAELATHVNMSEFHFQRMFTEWAGISPKKFLQYLTIEELKKELQNTSNLIQAAEQVGLSAQSRVYDLFVNIEAVTPQEYKLLGKGVEIEYGSYPSPFGKCLIASTKRGICALSFADDNPDKNIQELESHWQNAILKENEPSIKLLGEQIFNNRQKELKLFVKGTKFQVKVWEALLKIPFGSINSYQGIASDLHTNAVRAVGSAIANNPIGYLIPCHRVIRSEGVIGQYHWGPERKAAIIGWERSKKNAEICSDLSV